MLLPISSLAAMLACAAAGDTSYGRLDGDVALAASAGAAASVRGFSGVLDLRFRYLQTAGIFTTYEESFGAGAEPLRVFTGGIELRPLFLGRFFQDLELGSPHLDLLMDSLSFDVGAFVAQPAGGAFADVAGFSFGIGLELPWLGRASSPFIGVRAALRWSQEALSAAQPATVDVLGFSVMLVIGYQGLFGAHMVDQGDLRR